MSAVAHRRLRHRDRRRRRHRASPTGWILIEGDRIAAVGAGGAARGAAGDAPHRRPRLPRHARASSTATTTSTSGPRAGWRQQATLFGWLVALYPVWARHRRGGRARGRARRPGRAGAARAAPPRTDHHYVFPAGAGDLLAASSRRGRRRSACASTPAAARWTSGRSHGGLPPDEVVEDRDAILAATRGGDRPLPRPAPGRDGARRASRPCSPFSVTRELMGDAAELARRRGVRLHTHLAETLDEEEFCRERFGVRPVEYLDDARLARRRRVARPLRPPRRRRGRAASARPAPASRTARARTPGWAPASRPSPASLAAGAPVGLGVDGAASNEAGELALELRQALLFARLRRRARRR